MAMSEQAVGVVYIGATVIALVTAVILWHNREKKATLPLSVAGASAAVWAFGLFLSTLPWETLAIIGIHVVYLAIGAGLAAVFVFALEYTGRGRYITPGLLAVLAIHPILLAGFVLLNPGELFFIGLDAGAPVGVEQKWGPAFWVHSAYAYLLVLSTALLLLELIVRERRALYRGQALLLAVGVFAPLPLNAVFLAGFVEFDTTPLGFVVMCTLLAVAITKYRFVDISPIAREKVIDTVRDGMIVVDTDDRIIDINAAGREMLNAEGSMIGLSVEEALQLPESRSAYAALTAEVKPSERTVSFGDISFTIEATPVFDSRESHVGWLFLLQDVTEQKRRERDLEQQIEKLDEFATLVSHDLRNPINVANGYIEQTRLTGELAHLENVEQATERMEEIIDDVLALAREGQAVTEPEPVSIETIAQEAWTHIDTDGASLVVDDDGMIVADPNRLKRLFENLFRNSVEHGSTDSRPQASDSVEHGTDNTGAEQSDPSTLTVTVGTASEQSTTLTLYVADDGVGIPHANQDRVLEDGYTTGDDGTGLGLAIVEQIATAHGWTVSVTESETGGARFEISGITKPL